MSNNDVVIAGSARTPMGGMMGSLSSVRSPDLGAISIKAAIERSGLQPADVQEVIMGCVLPAGLGQAPARQASRASGIPDSSGCTTINKMCGSGMQAAVMGRNAILAGDADIVIAGGMESMTRAPYMVPKARDGMRLVPRAEAGTDANVYVTEAEPNVEMAGGDAAPEISVETAEPSVRFVDAVSEYHEAKVELDRLTGRFADLVGRI